MANFFISRPIFAWVLAIITMLAGALSIFSLPTEQYPDIAPPSISISANFPGASAQSVDDAITQVIEQQMKGLDGLRYISSSSSSIGTMGMTLSFEAGTDPDIAQVQVQNKLSRATPLLPEEVQRQGVTVNKARADFLLMVGLISNDPTTTRSDLADYVAANLVDPISRIEGVGGIQLFGSQYAMRIWLDPHALAKYELSTQEIINAIRAQNTQVTGGQIGGGPALPGQQLNASITIQSLLQTPEEFRNIPLRTMQDGAQVILSDVARVELGSEDYSTIGEYNGKSAAGIGIQLATGANALDTVQAARDTISELSRFLPEAYEIVYPQDMSPFVRASIHEVVKTLFEAALFVFLIMFLFLQNIRATAIVMITVPVVLFGTMAVLMAFGYSINTLTMLAMVLAIGLLVDDAIVVIENVDRVMEEENLSPREATKKAMKQISGALVGIGAVLSAVFVPMAFFAGTAGVIYRQFSVTIVTAMALSVFFALVLTPALCATLLKPPGKDAKAKPGTLVYTLSAPLRWFDAAFNASARGHSNGVAYILARSGRFILLFLLLTGATGYAFTRIEQSFLPNEDQGRFFVMAQLPAGATFERTSEVLNSVRAHFETNETENVEGVFTLAGFSFSGAGQNAGLAFVRLKDWEERKHPDQAAQAIANRAMGAFASIKDARVFAFTPPSVAGLGEANGFDFYLQDRTGQGHEALLNARNQLLGAAWQNPKLTGVRPNGLEDEAQLKVNIDHRRAQASGLTTESINATLATAMGGVYVNDFLDRGRIKRVYVAADAPYRSSPDDLKLWRIPNTSGELVPFSAFADTDWTFGSPRLQRYNGVPAMQIQGSAASGVSSGEAMIEIEKIVASLPEGFGIEWTGISAEERESGAQTPMLYTLSILIVFLCLAALYESWSVPFAVILIVPLGVMGAVIAALSNGLANDIFFQVALLTTIGLSAKNAILIVEFAKELEDKQGMSPIEAAQHAARARLRPILMTSFAFGLGVLPLALATGAGAAGRSAIGVAVLGGMIAASFLCIFFAPLFYAVIRNLLGKNSPTPAEALSSPDGQPALEA